MDFKLPELWIVNIFALGNFSFITERAFQNEKKSKITTAQHCIEKKREKIQLAIAAAAAATMAYKNVYNNNTISAHSNLYVCCISDLYFHRINSFSASYFIRIQLKMLQQMQMQLQIQM